MCTKDKNPDPRVVDAPTDSAAKVERMRALLEDGAYEVNRERLASRLVETVLAPDQLK